jgi:hypothetical protein
MKYSLFIFLFSVAFFAACSETDDIGTIAFTASHDCDIRLFNSKGEQIAREPYEVGKAPAVVYMKSSGVFIVHAASDGQTTVKEPVTYVGGNMEYFIEF